MACFFKTIYRDYIVMRVDDVLKKGESRSKKVTKIYLSHDTDGVFTSRPVT